MKRVLSYTHNKSGKQYLFNIDQETKNYYIEFEKGYVTSLKAKLKVGNTGSKVNGDSIEVYRYMGKDKLSFMHSFKPSKIIGYQGNKIVYLKKKAFKKKWFEENCSNIEILSIKEESFDCPF